MKRYVVVVLLGACCAVWAVPASRTSAASQGQVLKAAAFVEPVLGQPRVIVHLTNNASLALDAWQVRVDYQLASGSRDSLDITRDTLFDTSPAGTPDSGPILSGQTRNDTFSLPGVPLSTSVTIRMLLFEDLSYEGSAEEVGSVRAQRERHSRTLGTWIDALHAVVGKTDSEAKSVLRNALTSERAHADPSDSMAAVTLQSIGALLETNSAASQFSDQIRALTQVFERERERAIRRQAR